MLHYQKDLATDCRGHEDVGDREQEGRQPTDPFALE